MEQQGRASARSTATVSESATGRLSTLRLFQLLVRWEWPLRLLNPLLGDFNPFLRTFRIDPYPAYRKLQARHRVYVDRQ